MAAMDIRWIGRSGVETCSWADLDGLMARDEGFAWIDIPTADEDSAWAGGKPRG
jgi:hypothetical protein